jgi:hypothetical protein
MERVRDLLAEIRGEPAPKEFFRPGAAAKHADGERAS